MTNLRILRIPGLNRSIYYVVSSIIIGVVVGCASREPDERFLQKTYVSPSGDSLSYCLFVPDIDDPDLRYPLVMFLHGGQGIGTDNTSQISGSNWSGSHVWIQPDSQTKHKALVVAPQLPVLSRWDNNTSDELSIVKYTEYRFRGHSIWDRVYSEDSLIDWLFAQRKQSHESIRTEASASIYPQVVIQDSDRHELASALIDDTFKIHVYRPRGYDEMEDPIPTVYLLDAEYSFGAVAYIIRRLIKDNLIPPVLLVGVSYEVPYEEYYRRRERDFTPTSAHLQEFPNAGEGKTFGRFLREELVPFIGRTYRVIPEDRTIMGLSFSGLFLTYLLFNETDLCNRYVIVSPSLWWDNGVIFRYESDYHERHTDLQARVYLAAGQNDGPNIVEDHGRLEKVLGSRHYQGLEYRAVLFPEETHRTVFPIAVSHGLRFVFAGEE